MLLDFRTLSVNPNKALRDKNNAAMRKACFLFDKVTAISEGVAKELGRNDIHILPLGADTISFTKKDYNNGIRILYVGIFTNRNIEETIKGVYAFHAENPDVALHYRLIGYGTSSEETVIRNLIHSLDADSYIDFIGRVPHHLLGQYFDDSNVGISFVPQTDYFEHQPPTKIFEYCNSGLFCLATGTQASKDIITPACGIIIGDSSKGVTEGIQQFWTLRKRICENDIRSALQANRWQVIVDTKLIPVLKVL